MRATIEILLVLITLPLRFIAMLVWFGFGLASVHYGSTVKEYYDETKSGFFNTLQAELNWIKYGF